MRVEFKGLSLSLDDEGPKAREVASILFKDLVPALAPEPAPEPTPVPADFTTFWDRLSTWQKRELARLSKGRMDASDAREELGLTPNLLQGQHVLISKHAHACGITTPILARGRWPNRYYEIKPGRLELVKRFVEDDAAINEFIRKRRGL